MFRDPLHPYSHDSHGREQAKGMWMGRCREDWLKYIAAQLVSLRLHGESLLQIVLIIYENLPPAFAAAFPEA